MTSLDIRDLTRGGPQEANEANSSKGLRTADLFAGAGGLTLGLKQADFDTVLAVEWDPDAARTFAGHTPEAHLYQGDIRDISFTQYKGRIDVVCGGPPCQPFSSGGLRRAAADDRDMIRWFIDAVEEISPSAFLMENVPGLAVGTRRQYFDSVLRRFEDLGYEVTWKVLNAAGYGVPQIRRRLFIVGTRGVPFDFPAETHGPGLPLRYMTAGEVLAENPIGEPNRAKVIYAKKPDLRPSPYHGLLFNGGGRPIDLKQPAPTILATAGGIKTPFVDTLDIAPAYHKHLLRGDKPREGIVPGARRLTVQEAALLQTFPPSVAFFGSRSSQYRQVGNAVPPRLAWALGQALNAYLHGEGVLRGSNSRAYTIIQQSLFPTEVASGTMVKGKRNTLVHNAVLLALKRIDHFLNGGELRGKDLLAQELRRTVDDFVDNQKASVRTAGLFLVFYKVIDSSYDFTRPPVGWRGQYGDKLLAEELSKRKLTLHGNVVSPGENLGVKGAASNFNFTTDPRFRQFAMALNQAPPEQVKEVSDYLAARFAQSQKIMPTLPPVGNDVLTFVRAKKLFRELVQLETEGYVQQFLLAALFEQARSVNNIEIRTHHPHAADKYDRTAGDIEEWLNGQLYRAYEVTVRPDWKNRLSGLKAKMDAHGLRKYVVIASDVNEDDEWAEPANLALKLDQYGRDIAVVDMLDVLHWMAAELSARLRNAVNRVQELLINPGRGRYDILVKYKEAVEQWLNEISEDAS
jgi:DNA (cytosine-5)-methyltransferase 1